MSAPPPLRASTGAKARATDHVAEVVHVHRLAGCGKVSFQQFRAVPRDTGIVDQDRDVVGELRGLGHLGGVGHIETQRHHVRVLHARGVADRGVDLGRAVVQ